MKRLVIVLSVIALALPAGAQDDFNVGELRLGALQRDVDTISSKFFEYREVPQGAVVPYFRLAGKKGDYRYDISGMDVTQKDQRFSGRFGSDAWSLKASYVGIPHNFGNGGNSILRPVSETEWRLSDTLQRSLQTGVEQGARNYDSVFALVSPTLAATPNNIDIKLLRNRSTVSFGLTPGGGSFEASVTYFHERRAGARTNNGTSFGFNNVIETPEPVRYITQDLGVHARYTGERGVVFARFNVNDFKNHQTSFAWDNPFRFVDSTDSRAYLGPYTTTNGPSQGLAGLPPSNEAWTFGTGGTLKFGAKTRLSGDVSFGQWTQNEHSFIPFTVNTAVFLPDGRRATDVSTLPARNLDGKIDTLALNGFFTTALGDDVRLNARFRHYDNDNKTPRTRFEQGYVRFDTVWEEIPRITVPFGFTNNLFDVYATYGTGRTFGLEAGYKWNRTERTFRETEHTTDGTFRVAADVRATNVVLRGIYEYSDRDFDAYRAIEGEEHSFLLHGAPANQPVLRRYDQAQRTRNRIGASAQVSPSSGKATLVVSYFWNKDDYDDSPVECEGLSQYFANQSAFCPGGRSNPLGLLESKYQTFSVEGDVTPNDRASFYAFYSNETINDFQIGRQSGGTITFDPAFNWTSAVEDKVNTLGGGANFVLSPEKWFLDLFARWQKVDGLNVFTAGASQRTPLDITDYDDTELTAVNAQLKYAFKTGWAAAFGVYYEDYKLVDSQTGQVLNYMPGSFFINANSGDYKAWVGYVNFTHNW